MAEGPSTTATPSNQFVAKCSVRGHHVYKCIGGLFVGEQFETFCKENNEHDKYAMAVHLKNSLTVLGHIPREITRTWHFFIKNKGEKTGESKRKMTALHSSLWRSGSTMPADVLPQRHQGVGKSQRTCN